MFLIGSPLNWQMKHAWLMALKYNSNNIKWQNIGRLICLDNLPYVLSTIHYILIHVWLY